MTEFTMEDARLAYQSLRNRGYEIRVNSFQEKPRKFHVVARNAGLTIVRTGDTLPEAFQEAMTGVEMIEQVGAFLESVPYDMGEYGEIVVNSR